MSRAFVKDDADERWQAPGELPEFAVYAAQGGAFSPDPVRRGDDLLELVRWARARPRGVYQVRDRTGRLLAHVTEGSAS